MQVFRGPDLPSYQLDDIIIQITLIKRIVKLCRGIAGTLSGREDERVRDQQPDIIPARPHKLVNLIGKFRSLSSSAGSPDCDDTIDTSEISWTATRPTPLLRTVKNRHQEIAEPALENFESTEMKADRRL